MRKAGPHRWMTLALQLFFLVEAIFAIKNSQWFLVAITLVVFLITFFPVLLERTLRIRTPPQFYFLVIGFVVASLFFGEGQGYYVRFWWWDMLLHAVAGLLAGIVGFLLVYGAYSDIRISGQIKRKLVVSFSFFFSLSIGVIWEIFEFTMDKLFGTTMQMPMFGDSSGLTDTMWDLIMNTVGALAAATLGWRYLKQMKQDIIFESWINAFIDSNPSLFESERQRNFSG
jgi:uncharacterized membrane protein YjdF